MNKAAAASLAIALIGISCRSEPEGDLLISPPEPVAGPIVTGLYVTAEDGQALAVWRSPADHPQADSSSAYSFRLSGIFPNPAPPGGLSVMFTVPAAAEVHVWIAHARLTGATGRDTMAGRCGAVGRPDTIKVCDLVNAMLAAGSHTYQWDGNDDCGEPVPAGFYRVFLQQKGSPVLWRDLLLYRSPDDPNLKLVRSGG
jgi:hypothetical protein